MSPGRIGAACRTGFLIDPGPRQRTGRDERREYRLPMSAPKHGELAHFALNADDIPATQAFYQQVCGWRFTPWGPPGFFQISLADGSPPGVPQAALQGRRDLDDRRLTGPECTIAVDDVTAAVASVTAAGGRVVMEPVAIPTVGTLTFVTDPSGNVVGLMQYET